jgi:lipopolysaccharide export system protein LptA
VTSKKIFLLLPLIILLSASSLDAKDNIALINKMNSNEPYEIISDRMDAFNEKKMVVFSGNATARQGDKVLKSDQLVFYYKKEAGQAGKVGAKEIEMSGELEKIEAKGNVSVTQGERIATGDEAIYVQETGQIIMKGNAVLREGKNVIKGDRVIVYVNESRGTVESDPQKRVKAVIYPQEQKDIKETN